MVHVARFTTPCREAVADLFLKLYLFNMPLTKMTFTWYTSLPTNSVCGWDELEHNFHEQFYRYEPELSVANLALCRQKSREMVEEYLNYFKIGRNRYFVRIPNFEFS